MKTIQSRGMLILVLTIVGALMLTACGGGNSSGSNQAETVNLTLTEFKIDADKTSFKVGQPYHFVINNKGALAHSFFIMPVATGAMTDQQAKSTAMAGLTSDQLPAGSTQTLDYTFKDSDTSQQLEFACHVAGHYEGGMHTPITVSK
jgi:uncharacterized cupredoxin-like copper-binding protein